VATAAYFANVGPARAILSRLRRRRRPIAISLEVSEDPNTGVNNWTHPTAVDYGHVFDPVPGAQFSLMGHAVCVVGFVPDKHEPLGGFFIIRNSWGTGWARNAPDRRAGSRNCSPGPGYGQVSATYVDQYLWEWCQL
jgi:hypothetical protein